VIVKNFKKKNCISELKKKNFVRSIGVSVYDVDEALYCLDDKNINFLEIPFNILDKRWLKKKFQNKLNKRRDVKILARSIFLKGVLLKKSSEWPKKIKNRYLLEKKIDLITKKLKNIDRLTLCLNYVKHFKWIFGIVIGVRNTKQLSDIYKSFKKINMNYKNIRFIQNNLGIYDNKILNPSKW